MKSQPHHHCADERVRTDKGGRFNSIPVQLEELRKWFDDFYEDQLELDDHVKAKLAEARKDIQSGNYLTRKH
jgi:DNA replication protein DnaD